MGDTSIADDIIEGIADALGDLGSTRVFRIVTVEDSNENDPGAEDPTEEEDKNAEVLLFNFIQKYMPLANVLKGNLMAIMSLDGFTDDQVKSVKPGNYIIDGDSQYTIIEVLPIEVAGIVVTKIIQLKGNQL